MCLVFDIFEVLVALEVWIVAFCVTKFCSLTHNYKYVLGTRRLHVPP
jgi:hypothetical protein